MSDPRWHDGFMSSATASDDAPAVSRDERLLELYERLAELSGQRNAIDGQIVEIVAEIDRDGLWAGTGGLKSVKALVAWRLGMSDTTAGNVAAIADRYEEFPRCTAEMREGRLSLDQVGGDRPAGR